MIEDAVRGLFWAVAKLLLSMSDWMYEILQTVIGIDLSGDVLRYTWIFMLLFLSFACLVRIGFLLLKQTADDELENIDYAKLGKRIVGVFGVVAISLTFFTFSLGLPETITDIYNSTIQYDERLVPSSAVISSTAKTSISSSLGDMSATDEVISIDTIDEKLNTEEDGSYVYFFGYAELLLCIAGAFVVMCVQLNIVTDVVLRLFLNVFRFVIGFIPISSLIEDNSTCGEWARDLISDTIVMCTSLIFTNMVFGFMTTNTITSLNGIVRIVVFTIALMAVYRASEVIAKYMGASNLSSGGRMGTMLLGMGAFGAMRGIGKVMKGTVKYAASGVASGIDYFSSKGGNDDRIASGTGTDNPTSPLNSGGLGASINDVNENTSDYFVSNGSNGIDIGGNTSYKGTMNQHIDDSILDATPTSFNMDNTQTNENTFYERNQGTAIVSDDDMNISNHQDSGVDTNYGNSAMNNDGYNKGQEDVFNKGSMDNNDFEPFKNKMEQKKGYAFMQDGRFSMASAGFVDSQPSGHLFKGSNAVYKQSIRERYTMSSMEAKVNSRINHGIERTIVNTIGNEVLGNEDN
ncbi:hypothetical protein KB151_003881 [[Clostridium] innocuum]|nr:hypothetical protein [[Clostridium] innocuum]